MLDHWDYLVDGMGDCKIYALFKRKLLLDACFPRQALRPSSSFSTYRPPTDPSLILVKSPSDGAHAIRGSFLHMTTRTGMLACANTSAVWLPSSGLDGTSTVRAKDDQVGAARYCGLTYGIGRRGLRNMHERNVDTHFAGIGFISSRTLLAASFCLRLNSSLAVSERLQFPPAVIPARELGSVTLSTVTLAPRPVASDKACRLPSGLFPSRPSG